MNSPDLQWKDSATFNRAIYELKKASGFSWKTRLGTQFALFLLLAVVALFIRLAFVKDTRGAPGIIAAAVGIAIILTICMNLWWVADRIVRKKTKITEKELIRFTAFGPQPIALSDLKGYRFEKLNTGAFSEDVLVVMGDKIGKLGISTPDEKVRLAVTELFERRGIVKMSIEKESKSA